MQINTDYDVGDFFWVFYHGRLQQLMIRRINCTVLLSNTTRLEYLASNGKEYTTVNMFKTKADLLAQIASEAQEYECDSI